MAWWDRVKTAIGAGDILHTPGRGIDGGNKKRPFKILSRENSGISVLSGRTTVPLQRDCFDAVEEVLRDNPAKALRTASLRESDPCPDSVDEVIRRRTGSNLARGNCICAILEHCGLVKYEMLAHKKVIVRS